MIVDTAEHFNTLLAYDKAYSEGNPIVPDDVYDILFNKLSTEHPTHPYFETVGSEVRGGKIKLPHQMGSLDQVYNINDLENWLKRNGYEGVDLIASHKLDGISCLLHYNHGRLQQAFSRGDGIQGADITRHMNHVNVPKFIDFIGSLYVRAEVIMKNSAFKAKYGKQYKHPRNLVAGSMNRSTTDASILKDIDVVAYQIVEMDNDGATKMDGSRIASTKADTIYQLKEWGFIDVYYQVILGNMANFETLEQLVLDFKDASEYELDGMVLTSNIDTSTNTSTSSSLNPFHSVKLKVLEESSIVTATVVNVLWEISKSGYLKPRVEIEPVELFGTTVRFATGFNGNYIVSNNIGVGTTIKITKSGSVIPYILEVIKGTSPKLPDIEFAWNESNIEMVVDSDNNTVQFKQCLDFFNSIKVDLLKEASLTKIFDHYNLWDNSFDDNLMFIFDLISMEWESVLGTNGGKICDNLNRRLINMTPELLMGSLPYIGFGFGVRKATQLLKQISFEDLKTATVKNIEGLNGFDTKTADKVVNNLHLVLNFIDDTSDTIEFVEVETTEEMSDVVVVMTGFRDNALKEQIETMGGRVTSAVSKKTTHLLTNDINSSSSKVKKAKSLDIDVVLPETFKDEYNL